MKKRPERELYIIPAYRNNPENQHNITEYARDDYANEVINRRARSTQNSISRRIPSNTERRVISTSSSSSSNPKSAADELYKDDDSSDFEESSSECRETARDEEIMGIKKSNLDEDFNEDLRKKLSGKNRDIEANGYRTNTKVSNGMEHEGCSNSKYAAYQLSSDSSETELEKGLFGNYGDCSISYIDAPSYSDREKESVLTSTPNSDIVEQEFLEAAKYVHEESETESTLLDQNDTCETTINTNGNKPENFEIDHDPSFIKNEPKGSSEIFENNYIPPPVQPVFALSLPPISRLSTPVSSIQGVTVLQRITTQKIVQRPTPLQHPRPLLRLQHPNPLRQNHHLHSGISASSSIPSNPPIAPPIPRAVSSCIQLDNSPNLPRTFSRPTHIVQRFNPQLPPRVASNLQYLQQGTLNPRSAKSHSQDDSIYIHPPVPRPQRMKADLLIRNLNHGEATQSRVPYSSSLVKRKIFDEDLWPDD